MIFKRYLFCRGIKQFCCVSGEVKLFANIRVAVQLIYLTAFSQLFQKNSLRYKATLAYNCCGFLSLE
ncbi:MAG: hypothetical protein K0S08_1479 [Gammaproteobacteria bacterium]|jgi:hypothetical protein|nr:hypothetical protein [Gammaproteobacteria bacterium]